MKKKSLNNNQNGGIKENNTINDLDEYINKIINYVMFIETNNEKINIINLRKKEEEAKLYNLLKDILSSEEIKKITEIFSKKVILDIIEKNPIELVKNIIMNKYSLYLEEDKIRENSFDLMEKNKNKIIPLIQNKKYDLSEDKILELINLAYEMYLVEEKSDIYRFIETCNYIALKLNNLSKNIKLNVICPGDSPVKIIRYLEKLNLCPNCNFINFSLSRSMVNENTYNYIGDFIPDNYCNIVILDLIDSGYTLTMIYNAMKDKISKNKKLNNEENKLCLQQIGICFSNYIIKIYPNLKNKISDELKINRSIYQIMDEKYCSLNFKFLLNILDYWGWRKSGIFAWAENYNARCIVKNEEHIKLNDDFIKNINTFGCDFFIYLMILCKKNYEFVKKQNYNNYYDDL